MRAAAQAIAKGQRVLRAVAVNGLVEAVKSGVVQCIFAALERGTQAVSAQTVFVLPDVTAQLRFGAVQRRLGFVAAERVGDRQARAVGIAPLRIPGQASGAQAVLVAVIVRLQRLVAKSVIARIHVAGQQRGVHAVAGVDFETHARIA